MKVTLIEHGGQLAGAQRSPKEVDLSDVSKEDAAEWKRLLAAVDAEPQPPATGPGQIRDAMSYRISVVAKDGTTSELRCTDANMSQEFYELVKWISRHSLKR